MNELTARHLIDMIDAVNRAINAARDELNRLDSALGDGDHGTSLSAAFNDAVTKVSALATPTPSLILQVTAQSLLNRMGGASGALYGTLFLRASAAVRDKASLNHADMIGLWQSGLAGVMQRGKAQPGDKTMIDALQPAVNVFAEGDTLTQSFDLAAAAALAGAQRTSAMIARHGRAKFAGERAIGHVDAGARSIAILFEAMNSYWKETQNGEA